MGVKTINKMAAVVKAAAIRSRPLQRATNQRWTGPNTTTSRTAKNVGKRKLTMTWKKSTPINARMATRTISEMILAMVASPQKFRKMAKHGSRSRPL